MKRVAAEYAERIPELMRKPRFSLGAKLAVFTIIVSLLLSSAIIYFGYRQYRWSASEHFEARSRNTLQVISHAIDGNLVEDYISGKQVDAAYDSALSMLRNMQQAAEAAGLYVFLPMDEGMLYVYDTDTSEQHFPLGFLRPWPSGLKLSRSYIQNGFEVPPTTIAYTEYGLVFNMMYPVRNAQGETAAYLAGDFPMSQVDENYHAFLRALILAAGIATAIIALLSILAARRMLVRPIRRMALAADTCLLQEAPDSGGAQTGFHNLAVHTGDELELLADSLKSMAAKNSDYLRCLETATKKAQTDVLTGLFNRGTMEARATELLQHTIAHGQLHAFLMIDFDEFKTVNDTYGHMQGDEALKALAAALRAHFRSSDIIARMGGDEFAVFCVGIAGVAQLEEKLRQLMDDWRATSLPDGRGGCFSSTLSIGAAIAPRDSILYGELFHKADIALYKSKQNGRDQYTLFDPATMRDIHPS